MSPVFFNDDFTGKIVDVTNNWSALTTGSPTAAGAILGGQHQANCNIAASNEVELAGLYQADQKAFILNQGLTFEARIQLKVTPTGVVKAGIGLLGSNNAALLSVAQFMMFVANGSGLTIYTSTASSRRARSQRASPSPPPTGDPQDRRHEHRERPFLYQRQPGRSRNDVQPEHQQRARVTADRPDRQRIVHHGRWPAPR